MKGKGQFRFTMPNVQRLRSRVENPSKDLSSQIREHLQKTACKILNGNQVQIKAELIAFVDALDLEYKNPQHKAQVMNLTSSIFDSYYAHTPEELDKLLGTITPDPEGEKEPSAPKAKVKTEVKAEVKNAAKPEASKDADFD